MIKNFLLKVLFFSIPIVVFFIIPIVILKVTGENFTDIKLIVKNKSKYLIGYAYNEKNYGYLKWINLIENPKYEIWSLGSSRVLQFRKEMFKKSFYNAGYTISKISDFKTFLQSIPKDKYPKYLIIGLDQWMFNFNWNNGNSLKAKDYWEKSFSETPKFNTYISVYKDIIKGKYSLDIIYTHPETRIGLNSVVNNKGFRNDGSIYYGTQIHKLIINDKSANDFEFNDTFNRIMNGNRRFEYGNNVNQIALKELNELLSYCRLNNIIVVGFIPPFAHSVYVKMQKSNNYNYLNNISEKIIPIFKKYDYEFYNYLSAIQCNSTDKEFIDGFHGGEVVYSNILIDMLKNNSILNDVTNVKKIENDKNNKKNRYIIYKYE